MTGFVLGAVQGCGSSGSSTPPTGSGGAGGSGSTDYVTICTNACVKDALCVADAGASETMAACMSMCTTKINQEKGCATEAQIAQMVQNCLTMGCSTFVSCFGAIKDTCGAGGTSGAAGKSGAAGSTGAGGAGVPADCSACTKAANCCSTAGLPSTLCAAIPSAASCNTATGTTQTQDIGTCMSALTYAATMGITCP